MLLLSAIIYTHHAKFVAQDDRFPRVAGVGASWYEAMKDLREKIGHPPPGSGKERGEQPD